MIFLHMLVILLWYGALSYEFYIFGRNIDFFLSISMHSARRPQV